MDRLTIGWDIILLKTILILGVIATLGTAYFFNTLQQPIDSPTIVLGHPQEIPLPEASFRIMIQEPADGLAVEGAISDVEHWSEQAAILSLLAGQIEDCSSQPVTFSLPADIALDQPLNLVVQTEESPSQPAIKPYDQMPSPVQVLLMTDQPTYQPGQTIQLRALALQQQDQTPATGLTVNFLVTDSQGHQLWQEKSVTSEFGIAAIDFTLPAMVHHGRYTLRLQVTGEATSPANQTVILTEIEQIIEVQADMPAHTG